MNLKFEFEFKFELNLNLNLNLKIKKVSNHCYKKYKKRGSGFRQLNKNVSLYSKKILMINNF